MRFRRNKPGSPIVRPIPALLALIAGLGLSATLAWAGSTELGETTSTPVYFFTGPVVAVQTTAGTPSYSTPDGVLTRWRFHSVSGGEIKLEIFRFTGTAKEYEFVAESSFKPLDPDKDYEFHEQLPVKEGDLLGLLTRGGVKAGITVGAINGRDVVLAFPPGEVPVGSTVTTQDEGNFPDSRLGIAATVESDADNDGLGDDSQDLCPGDPQNSCPAATTGGNSPTGSSATDKRAPALALASATSQDVLARGAVFVTVKSDENGTATGRGTLSVPGASKVFKLKSSTRTVAAGKKTKLKLRVTRKALRAAKRSVRRGKRVRAKTTVQVRDAAGNIAIAKRTIKVKRPK